MIHMGLSLLTVALESGSHHIGTFPSLMNYVKDDMCKNLFWVRTVVHYIPFNKSTAFSMVYTLIGLVFYNNIEKLRAELALFSFKKACDVISYCLYSYRQ